MQEQPVVLSVVWPAYWWCRVMADSRGWRCRRCRVTGFVVSLAVSCDSRSRVTGGMVCVAVWCDWRCGVTSSAVWTDRKTEELPKSPRLCATDGVV